ncbi:MAG: ABC transporter permease [Acidobacteriia bacterium]|nr:ABC transporter permease [Terriglobia bacterium]
MLIAIRSLGRASGFSATAIAVLGLGLGVNMILFNAAYALLWRPLRFPAPDRLMTVMQRDAAGEANQVISGWQSAVLREQTTAAEEIGLAGTSPRVTVFQGNEPVDLEAAEVSSGYFRALGLRPLAGRFFAREEDLGEGAEQQALLTEAAWRKHFAGDYNVVGRRFAWQAGSERRQLRVVGIVPGAATLPFASGAELLLPIPWLAAEVSKDQNNLQYRAIVRLKAGVNAAQASAQLDAAVQAAERAGPGAQSRRFWMEPLRAALAPVSRRTIFLLYGAACLLLVLTCANMASLFAARRMGRAHETAVRLALGATRLRLAGAQFQEAALVCMAGTALALLLNRAARPLVLGFLPELRTVGAELLVTGPVLVAFGIVTGLVAALVVALAPEYARGKSDLAATLAQGGRGGMAAAGRWRAALVGAQVALVLTLLTVGGLVGRSFLAAVRSDAGFDATGVVTFQAKLPVGRETILSSGAELAGLIAALPGTRRVAFAEELPVGPASSSTTSTSAGGFVPTDPSIAFRLVSGSYFDTLGAHMKRGRSFTDDEVARYRTVVVLNEAAARLLFRGEDPIGRIVHTGFTGRRSTVVGVVQDMRTTALDQPGEPMIYMPCLPLHPDTLVFAVRIAGRPAAFLPVLKSRVLAWNSGVRLRNFQPLGELLDDSIRARLVAGALVGGFALLGLIISSVGLYGTLAGQVHQRRREIGVRMALGATVAGVVALVLVRGWRMVAGGALAGLAGSAVAARLVRQELYGVGPTDAASFALALGLLSLAALAACLLPALRAARVDPAEALKTE